jgi:hypothetical protein
MRVDRLSEVACEPLERYLEVPSTAGGTSSCLDAEYSDKRRGSSIRAWDEAAQKKSSSVPEGGI